MTETKAHVRNEGACPKQKARARDERRVPETKGACPRRKARARDERRVPETKGACVPETKGA